MSHTIVPSEDKKYIMLTFEREINRGIAMKQFKEAHVLGRKLGIDRYLVDVTAARNTDTTMGQYSFAYDDLHQAEEIDRHARVAVLVSPDDHSHDFIETVTRNAGWQVKFFTDRAKALAHLLEE
jgi:hypothetical protein